MTTMPILTKKQIKVIRKLRRRPSDLDYISSSFGLSVEEFLPILNPLEPYCKAVSGGGSWPAPDCIIKLNLDGEAVYDELNRQRLDKLRAYLAGIVTAIVAWSLSNVRAPNLLGKLIDFFNGH